MMWEHRRRDVYTNQVGAYVLRVMREIRLDDPANVVWDVYVELAADGYVIAVGHEGSAPRGQRWAIEYIAWLTASKERDPTPAAHVEADPVEGLTG